MYILYSEFILQEKVFANFVDLEYCIAYKVWLKYENVIRGIFIFTKYASTIDMTTFSPAK